MSSRARWFGLPKIQGEPQGATYQVTGSEGLLTQAPTPPVNYYGIAPTKNTTDGIIEWGMPPRREMRITIGGAFGSNTLYAVGWVTPTAFQGTNTGSSGNDTNLAPYQKWETGAVNGDKAGWDLLSEAGGAARVSYLPQVVITIKTGSSIANQTIWVGCSSLEPGSAFIQLLAFRYIAGTDTNWKGVCTDLFGTTVLDTGVAVAADQEIRLMFRVLSSTAVEFWTATSAGWTLRGTTTTNLPDQTSALFPIVRLITNTGAAKHFYFSDFWHSMR